MPATKQKLRILAPSRVLKITAAVRAISRSMPTAKKVPLPLPMVTLAKFTSPFQPTSWPNDASAAWKLPVAKFAAQKAGKVANTRNSAPPIDAPRSDAADREVNT